MLDVSDGLLGDLAHILERSECGALIEDALLPIEPLRLACGNAEMASKALLGGGDDYELLFTAPPARRQHVLDLSQQLALPLTRIGTMTDNPNCIVMQAADGSRSDVLPHGYDHFRRES
jgi:thiamine-monophosphate kinase